MNWNPTFKMNMQIIITGGTILDGSGGEPFVGDVLTRLPQLEAIFG